MDGRIDSIRPRLRVRWRPHRVEQEQPKESWLAASISPQLRVSAYLVGLIGERLLHLGGLLLTRPQPVVVQALDLAQLPLPHLLLLLVHLGEK